MKIFGVFSFCTVVLVSLTGDDVFQESDSKTFDVCVAASVDGDDGCPMEFNVTFLVKFIRIPGKGPHVSVYTEPLCCSQVQLAMA